MSSGAKIGLAVAAVLVLVIAAAGYAIYRGGNVWSEERTRWAAANAAGDAASLGSYLDWVYETAEGGGIGAWVLSVTPEARAHAADADARVTLAEAREALASGEALRVCGAAREHPELAEVDAATAALRTRASAAVDAYVSAATASGARSDLVETVALGLRRAAREPCVHGPLVVPTLTITEASGLDAPLGGSTETAHGSLELDAGLFHQTEWLRTSLDGALETVSGGALGDGTESTLVVTIDAQVNASVLPFSVEDGTDFPGLALDATISVRAPLPASLGETWTGSYTCAQGLTALALEIEPAEAGRVRARFDFSTYPGGAPLPDGGFLLSGTLDPATGALSLDPDRWIQQPDEDWVMVAVRATIDARAGTASGRVLDPTCGALSVTRTASASARSVVRRVHLELPESYGTTITVTRTQHDGWTETSYPWVSIYSGMLSNLDAQLAAYVRQELGIVETPHVPPI